MKTKLALALLTTATFLTGCATQKDLDAANQRINNLESSISLINARLDTRAQAQEKERRAMKKVRGCYLGGQLYSPGSVVAGRICTDARMIKTYPSNGAEEWSWQYHTTK